MGLSREVTEIKLRAQLYLYRASLSLVFFAAMLPYYRPAAAFGRSFYAW